MDYIRPYNDGPAGSVTEDAPPRPGVAAVRALPTAVVAGLGAWTAWSDRGSIAAADWLPWAIVALLVLAVALLFAGAVRPPRLVALAALAFAALAGWEAISLTWSPAPELARDEALLTALVAAALLVPAVTLRTRLDRELAAGAVVAILGAVAVATAVRLARAHDAAGLYDDGRLDSPVSYPNAAAAFFLVGLWPALALAARRATPAPLRALALAAGTALLGCWALAQSKGGAVGLVASAIVAFALVRERLRLLVPTAVAAVLVGIAFRPLTGPFRASDAGLTAAVHRAAKWELVVTAVAALAGVAWTLVDRRVRLSPRLHRVAGVAVLALLVLALAGGVAAFFAKEPHPGRWAHERWVSFKHLPTHHTAGTHLLSLGSNRYDFWRVALHEFGRHPVGGIGARGFRAAYLLERRSNETPARAHSVELDVLSEDGIVGFLLLAAALAAALGAAAARARRSLLGAALLAAGVYWLVHSSVDWTWTFPAIGLPLFALLGVGGSDDAPPPLRTRVAVPAGVAVVVVAALAFVPPWLSSRYASAAVRPGADAARDLRRAKRLDPLSTNPYLVQWALAPTPRAGIPPLAAAVRKEPRSADLRFVLGRQELLAGDRAAARRELGLAHRLNPRDELILGFLRRAGG